MATVGSKLGKTILSSSATAAPVDYAKTTKKIPPQTVEFLKASKTYSSYYSANKKFAIYFTGMDCPYGQAFSTAMAPLVSDPSYQAYYSFMPTVAKQGFVAYASQEEANKQLAFDNLCHEFCIINPVKDEIYYLDGVGAEDAANMKKTFDDLKNW